MKEYEIDAFVIGNKNNYFREMIMLRRELFKIGKFGDSD